MTYRARRTLTAYALLAPAIVYFTVYFIGPIVVELWASLRGGQPMIGSSEFVGLANYVEIFRDQLARKAAISTIIYSFGATFLTLVFALGLSAILSGPVRARNTIRAIIFFPYIVSFVIGALMWKSILDPYTGLLNAALMYVGSSASKTGLLIRAAHFMF